MDGNLTLDELYAAANEMCRKWWGVDYTGTIRLTNAKWRAWRGYFILSTADDSLREIRMSRWVNAKRTRDDVLGTLLHELVHWRLFTLGLPNNDADQEFVAECTRVGAPISGAIGARRAAQRYGGVAQ
ncbi:SprT-like domain-containing protein [Brevibacillus brevis]|uniref:SprT-like domain-containing protein n=1 Tax=Brevibacillus brevis TaxID=1393 RepID=UPI00165E4DEE|nr:SprT-like domain-containing protein [Brevibacillus brevis]